MAVVELMIEFCIDARVVLETVIAHKPPSRWTLRCQGIRVLNVDNDKLVEDVLYTSNGVDQVLQVMERFKCQ